MVDSVQMIRSRMNITGLPGDTERQGTCIDRDTQNTMAIYTLFQDAEDLHTIVSGSCGWRGAVWSSSIFVCDAWSLASRRKTELDRPIRAWASRMVWPESIATWCAKTGDLVILDDEPGLFASEYLGLVYDRVRWDRLDPEVFPAGLLAVASNSLTVETAACALAASTPEQFAAFSNAQVQLLLSHESPVICRAAVSKLSAAQRPNGATPQPAHVRLRHARK